MSMYNALFGENPASEILLGLLGLERGDFYRYRDCYLTEDGGEIAVYTRGGGGNRDDNTTDVAGHPNYLSDSDDDFDCTYATYYFSVPEAGKKVIDMLKDMDTVKRDPAKAWEKLIADLHSGGKPDDPAVKNAMEVGRRLFGFLGESLKKEET